MKYQFVFQTDDSELRRVAMEKIMDLANDSVITFTNEYSGKVTKLYPHYTLIIKGGDPDKQIDGEQE